MPSLHRTIATLAAVASLGVVHVNALFETTYHSSPLAIQPFTILERAPSYDPDNTTLYLVCPEGSIVVQPSPVIYKSTGELVWADPSFGACTDLNFQEFEGETYLTFWVGLGNGGPSSQTGSGTAMMMNDRYEVVRNVSAVNPRATDFHEFHIVKPENATALLTAYNPIPLNLTSIGGPEDGWYLNAVIQEVDIATGLVLFNWTSIDHIALSESYNNISQTQEGGSESAPWDAVHINSIDKDHEGNYLISARHSQAIYKIDKNGTIIWRLGGKSSDFTPVAGGGDTEFHWQHHARWRTNETQISLFDDGAAALGLITIVNEIVATGKYLNVDQDAMTVSLAKRFFPAPNSHFSGAEGSIEPYGDTVLVGYGTNPWVIAYDFDTQDVLFSAVIGPNISTGIENYRAYATSTLEFVGRPTTRPNASVEDDGKEIYVSWNGATHVAEWALFTGEEKTDIQKKVITVPKTGFETQINGTGCEAFVQIAALAANGTTLGVSAVYSTSNGSVVVP